MNLSGLSIFAIVPDLLRLVQLLLDRFELEPDSKTFTVKYLCAGGVFRSTKIPCRYLKFLQCGRKERKNSVLLLKYLPFEGGSQFSFPVPRSIVSGYLFTCPYYDLLGTQLLLLIRAVRTAPKNTLDGLIFISNP